MRESQLLSTSSCRRALSSRPALVSCVLRFPIAAALLAAFVFPGTALNAQNPNQVTGKVDASQPQVLVRHLPNWANPENDAGPVPVNQVMDNMTVVLARPPQLQLAFENFLTAQQDPSSPDYHRWLTPAEVGQRFGPSPPDIAAVTGWLQSQGLHVNWISPSRMFIGFGGTAADLDRAFQTELHYYNVRNARRMSVSSDPLIPQALSPTIRAIHGLYTVEDKPAHHIVAAQSASPELTASNGSHFLAPSDFRTIYNLPSNLSGAGVTIGIVGRSRTNFADFANFRNQTSSSFPDPTEIVPTAYGGVDPGPALTAPPSAGVSTGEQGEATLDVLRAASIAPGAQVLLVVASSTSGGIEADAQYLVQTSPVPIQVMTISYGACESAAGKAGVDFWDALFQQAAAEGISSFVASGDSGASGCDDAFATPPLRPLPNSPNYLCSSGYATCVGGTQFADTANPALYWNSTNDYFLSSALSYIPEGAWNEPGTAGSTVVAASGGGVSTFIPTPDWQTGTGVPAGRSGRYSPDISFAAAQHDGYFGCFAASGGSCVAGSNGSFTFVVFAGTSASAPSAAGIAALLDQDLGVAQGNLNPGLYQLAAAMPSAFHDVTVATSGVTSCSAATPSTCNNSIPGPLTLTGGQAGFLVTAGYDLATGLGSFDASAVINNFVGTKATPTLTLTPSQPGFTTAQQIILSVWVSGAGVTAPTGTVTLSSGSYTSAPSTLSGGSAQFVLPAGTLPAGDNPLTATYSPDATAARLYNPASGSTSVVITAVGIITPLVNVMPGTIYVVASQPLTVQIDIVGGAGNQNPSGTVTLTSGSYTSSPAPMRLGSSQIVVPAQSLALGTDTLTAVYAPDSPSASIYSSASGSTIVTVTANQRIYPGISVIPSQYTISNADTLSVTVSMSGVNGNPTPTGSVILTGGTYTSPSKALNNGNATFSVPAGSLPPGADYVSVNYTPDAASVPFYLPARGAASITVTDSSKITPVVSVTPSLSNVTTAQLLPVLVTVNGGAGNPVPTGGVHLSSGAYSFDAEVIGGSAAFAVPATALAIGTVSLTASYTPNTPASATYNPASGSAYVTVAAATPISPAVTLTPTATSITTNDSLSVTVNVSAGSGYQIPTGTVVLTSGSYTSEAPSLFNGSATIQVSGASLPVGADLITATYTPSGYSTAIYASATGSTTITVSTPPQQSFTISGTSVTVRAGTTTGNTSTITVAPSGGLVGYVALTAVVRSTPVGARFLPTLSFGNTNPVLILSAASGTATLTITTTAPTTASAAPRPTLPGHRWYPVGGAALACLCFFVIPTQRRRWRKMLAVLALFAFLAGGVSACGGGGGGTIGGGSQTTSGTTPGAYELLISGQAGVPTASCTVTLTVQ